MSDKQPVAGKHLLIIVCILMAALAIALPASQTSSRAAGIPLFLLAAIAAFSIQWLAFIPAWLIQTEHFFDLTGSITFLAVTWGAYLLSDSPDLRSLLLTLLVTFWAIRLGSFLFLRVRKDGSDGRFDDIKPVFTRFLLTWTLQGLWVFLSLAAALTAITSMTRQPMQVLAWIGVLLWLIGFVLETLADLQKRDFRRNPENRGRFISSGLWSWSRHPNYFGEILLWTGIALIAAPVFEGWQWLGLISPVFVFLLITRVSGIPMLEDRAWKRWGNDPDYRQWRQKTSRLIPLPPGKLPQ